MYHRVAAESPHGDGSISMLENLLSRWKGKLFVLVLLGFAATSFIITITLSAADAAAHIVENPFVLAHFPLLNHRILVTLILLTALGAIFLKGFKEAIGIAVFLVAAYLLLNVIVICGSLPDIHPPGLILKLESSNLPGLRQPLDDDWGCSNSFPQTCTRTVGF
jgi:hypothetical protein